MKLWLLEILACPIDHAYPLELSILRWRGESNEGDNQKDAIKELIENYNSNNLFPDSENCPIVVQKIDGDLLVHDTLILKPTPFNKYLSELNSKIDELSVVSDHSTWEGTKALDLIKGDFKKVFAEKIAFVEGISGNDDVLEKKESVLKEIQPKLEFLNLFKYYLEIEEGLITCPKCKRWYPIFESIPQMLPDGVRNTKRDEEFKSKWQDSIKFPN